MPRTTTCPSGPRSPALSPALLVLALACFPLLACGGTSDHAPPGHSPAKTLALVGVIPLDSATGRSGPPSTVLIEAGHITAIGDTVIGEEESIAIPDGATTVDATGLYLLPGLWDLHVHLYPDDEHTFPLLVTQGVLGVREMGGELEEVDALRQKVASGELLGPRIVRVGPTLNGAPNGPHHRVIDSPEAARAAVAELAEAGVDLLKTHNATGRETYFALLDAADEAGLTVAGHIPTGVTPLEACTAGQAGVEHIATLFEGTYLASFDDEMAAYRGIEGWLEGEGAELADCFAERGVLFTPTLRTYEQRAHRAAEYDDPDPRRRYLGEWQQQQWREGSVPSEIDRRPDVIELREQLVVIGLAFVRMLDERGAPLGTGTDLGVPGILPGFGLHAEIRLLARAGLTPAAALRAATRGPGEKAGGDPLQGRLVPGAPADLILLRANAFQSLDALDSIEAVVLRGKLLDRAALDRVLGELEAK